MTSARSEYWMLWDSRELAGKLCDLHRKANQIGTNPLYETWVKNTYYYYSNVFESQSPFSSLGFVGEQGELVQMRVPQARSLIRQTVTLVTKQKLAFACTAQTEDRSVIEEMRIGDAIVADTCKTQTVDVTSEELAEDFMVVGTGFIKSTWRTDRGLPFTTDDQGNVIFEGAPEITVPKLGDMLYNWTIKKWDDQIWAECRVKRNRYDLIAQFPELKEQIIALPSVREDTANSTVWGFDEEDNVYVYELYHKPTPAIPKGRMMFYSDPNTVYLDGDNLYGCIPIEQSIPEPINGIGYGFPMFSALLPAQEMLDHEFSAVATNHSAYGIHNVSAPRGASIEVQDLFGLNLLSYTPMDVPGGGKPEPLQLMQASPEAFKFMDGLLHAMQQISNLNAALRGDIGTSTSGVAIATLTTNALEFLSSYSKALALALERTMYHVINAYTRFAGNARMVKLVGKNHQTYLKKYKGEQLRAINGVKLQAVNPLLQTLAGRMEIAEKSIQNKLVTDLKGYASILDGEPLQSLFESEQSQDDLIATENQMMLDGIRPKTLSVDNHPRHAMKHFAILNDVRARSDPKLVSIVMDHIIEHRGLVEGTDPVLLAMVNTGKMPEVPEGALPPPPGQPPGPPPPPQGALPPGPQGPNPSQGQQPEEKPSPIVKAAMQQAQQQVAKPAQPTHDMLGRGA